MKDAMSRRELIKWAAPVVATAALPAHAQASSCGANASITAEVVSIDPPNGSTLAIGDSVTVILQFTSTNLAPDQTNSVGFIFGESNAAAFNISSSDTFIGNEGMVTLIGQVEGEAGSDDIQVTSGSASIACSGDVVDFVTLEVDWLVTF